jgi:hypothetical protein
VHAALTSTKPIKTQREVPMVCFPSAERAVIAGGANCTPRRDGLAVHWQRLSLATGLVLFVNIQTRVGGARLIFMSKVISIS